MQNKRQRIFLNEEIPWQHTMIRFIVMQTSIREIDSTQQIDTSLRLINSRKIVMHTDIQR